LRTLDAAKRPETRMSSARASRENPQPPFDHLTPGVITEGFSARQRLPDGVLFVLCLRLVDVRDPINGSWNRPFTEERCLAAFLPPREAGPSPVFRMLDETRSKRIALDVSTDPEKVSVVADGNRFETSLIDCSLSIELADRLPSSRVRSREPVHEAGERSVHSWREQKMPVVWHDTVRKKRNVASSDGQPEDTFESLVVCGVLEKSRTFCGSVDDMEVQTGGGDTRTPGHRERYQRKRSAGEATVESVLIK
jgi:hypothetical protein